MLELSFFGQFIASLGLGALLVLGYERVLLRFEQPHLRVAANAVLFSIGAIATMVNPIELNHGLFFDARAVIIALAGPFGGPVVAVAAGLSACVMRVLLGGVGVGAGLIGICYATAIGIVFYCSVSPRYTPRSLFVLGCLTALMGVSLIAIGFERALPAFTAILVPLSVVNVGGVVLLGLALESSRSANEHLRVIEYEVELDPLTQLLNRRALAEIARQLEDQRHDADVVGCVILFDIDRFKCVNDRYGHQRGDLVLQKVAQTIGARIRHSDIAVRYGGEEIALVLMGAPLESARLIAEQTRALVETTRFAYEGEAFGVTISAGVAAFDLQHTCLEQALDLADRALYMAKNAGRNRVEVYTDPSEKAYTASRS